MPLNDGDEKDRSVCFFPVDYNGRKVQRCMRDLVTANDVIRAIEKYHEGGALRYLPEGVKTFHAEWEDRISK